MSDGPIVVRDQHHYRQLDLAKTHRSDAGTQAQVPEGALAPLLEQVERDGFVVLHDIVDAATVATMKSTLEPALGKTGRNTMEGLRTQRLYGVMGRTRMCDPIIEHPLVLGLLDRYLQPNYLLSQAQLIRILPGEQAQILHHDDAFYPLPRPRAPVGAAIILALDDFTADNGATVVIPGSHRWAERAPRDDVPVPVVMPAGSAVFFVGTLWHGGGANRSAAPRACLTAQYCNPWLRVQENFFLSVPVTEVAQRSPHIQRLLGYSIYPPFVGMVNGMHPKRALPDV